MNSTRVFHVSQFDPSNFKVVTLSKAFSALDISSSLSESAIKVPGDPGSDGDGNLCGEGGAVFEYGNRGAVPCGDGWVGVSGEGSSFGAGDCDGVGVCCCEDDAMG